MASEPALQLKPLAVPGMGLGVKEPAWEKFLHAWAGLLSLPSMMCWLSCQHHSQTPATSGGFLILEGYHFRVLRGPLFVESKDSQKTGLIHYRAVHSALRPFIEVGLGALFMTTIYGFYKGYTGIKGNKSLKAFSNLLLFRA